MTWWGHASATVDLAGRRVATDPLLVGRLAHLRRHAPLPPPRATEADVVLVSHLHGDHLHPASLASMDTGAELVVPTGARTLLPAGRRVHEVAPGDHLEVAGVGVEVVAATHDGRRAPWSRLQAPALGFRVSRGDRSCWYPGDTGPAADFAAVAPVDLALVPVGGWGPSLGEGHLDPVQAADAVRAVGARAALPVHWGTYWPVGLERLARDNHHRLFVTPGARFAEAVGPAGCRVLLPDVAERVVL